MNTKGLQIEVHEFDYKKVNNVIYQENGVTIRTLPAILTTKQRFPVEDALNVGTQVHTSPAMFGKVMSEIKPRMAVGYHFFNDFDTLPEMTNEVRKTYDGPLTMAVDYMVWNVTKDDIRVRMTLVDEDVWPQPSITEKLPALRRRKLSSPG